MFHKKKSLLSLALLALSSLGFAQNSVIKDVTDFIPLSDSVASYMKPLAAINVKIKVDSVEVGKNNINIHFTKLMSDYYFRDNIIKDVYSISKSLLPDKYKDKKLSLYANGSTLEELASKFYSNSFAAPKKGKGKTSQKQGDIFIENLSRPYSIPDGLTGKHLAVWQSHGLYYDQPLQRWEWQRARIFETVEDLYTQSYVLPFLVPMLENAGANVFLPRERDINLSEIIVDNDNILGGYSESLGDKPFTDGDSLGFANAKESYLFGENPFRMGTYRQVASIAPGKGKNQSKASCVKWIPSVDKQGNYAVYISYKSLPNSAKSVYYTVKYNGGETKFKVNQQMGGGTWIYLGTFPFSPNSAEQGVYLSNLSDKEGMIITADAVKFGGGMGNIARKPSDNGSSNNVKSSSNEKPLISKIDFDVEALTSGYPRFTEGARYWLQWAGYADTVYSYSNNTNDYNDDYVSRGRWVNVLSGGSKMNPDYNGLKVPIDMAFAFHTDAGTFLNDSIVGSLAIYTRYSNGSDKYPTGKSRMDARQMTDIIQTQIVDDIRAGFEPSWSRRGLWDRSYSESRSPNVPSMLLELLSHQNFADMKYGLDPTFRFTVSRAIYKGIVKYFSLENGGKYTIAPLPVKNFAIEFANINSNEIKLSWSAVKDNLEPTADAKKFVVYTKINDGGFDNGVVVSDTSYTVNISANCIYSFKVAALNDGGLSFPSEVLSAGISSLFRDKQALIVNGFDRISAPVTFDKQDSTFAGFNNMVDNGVPYMYDYSFIGAQHEFRREIPWMDDDAPGFGASYANYEDKVVAGNTFDYPYVHGVALLKHGYSFVSSSMGALSCGKVSADNYKVLDIIMGKQKQTKVGRGVVPVRYEVFPVAVQNVISNYCSNGGNLLISGANIATDLWDSYNVTKQGQKFATDVLKYRWMTNYATTDGKVKSVSNPYGFKGSFAFNTKLNDRIYAVESADALVPSGKDSYTIFRYSDNNISAGVAYKGNYRTVSLGFPIETLNTQEEINSIFGEVIKFFELK